MTALPWSVWSVGLSHACLWGSPVHWYDVLNHQCFNCRGVNQLTIDRVFSAQEFSGASDELCFGDLFSPWPYLNLPMNYSPLPRTNVARAVFYITASIRSCSILKLSVCLVCVSTKERRSSASWTCAPWHGFWQWHLSKQNLSSHLCQ